MTSTTDFDDEFEREDEIDDTDATLASDRLNRKKSALSRLGGKIGQHGKLLHIFECID